MRINSRRVSAVSASILLVALGLGIVYLVTVERLSFLAAAAIVVAAGAGVPVVLALCDFTGERDGPGARDPVARARKSSSNELTRIRRR